MSNELGHWIEKERIKRGWSQRRLAREAGISQAPISRIINKVPLDKNEQLCGEKVAQALARVFGANPIYVLRLARILKPPTRSRNFSTWLIGELLLRQLTQEELAKQSGLDIETVADLTRGIPPTLEIADQLAEALDLETEYVERLAGLLSPGEQVQDLSELEVKLISKFRELGDPGQQIIWDLIQSLGQNRY